jgi:hypothetical protein
MGDLASALADPVPAIGYGVVVPEPPPANPFARPVEGPSAAALASQRLARLAAENPDVDLLRTRLLALEDRLATARAEALELKRDAHATEKDLDYWGEKVGIAVNEAHERGVALALDGLLRLEPKALERLGEVQSNSRAWNRLTGLLQEGSQNAHGVIEISEKFDEKLGDARQLMARRDLKEDVTFLAKRLGGQYAELAGSIVASAQNVRDELEAWKHIDLDRAHLAGTAVRVSRLPDLRGLQGDLKAVREAISSATGISAKDLVQAPPELKGPGLGGYAVPNPRDNP